MRSALPFLLFTLFSIATFAQISPDSITSEADLLIIDSLEVAAAEEEMMYKEDTADFVYFYLPT